MGETNEVGDQANTIPARAVASERPPSAGVLYVVATPIGNLCDLSPRACDVLKSVDCICAEDTRTSAALLTHFGIQQRLQTVHEHNEDKVVPALVRDLQAGASLALISDAGTPLVSDPGYRLVSEARHARIPVLAVPGPSAVVAALSVSGLPTDRFVFEGFLPARRKARRERLRELAGEPRTWVCYESTHRIAAAAEDCAAILEERPLCVARELTKRFEESARMPAGELPQWLAAEPKRTNGEFVLVVQGAPESETNVGEAHRVLELLMAEMSPSAAARVAAELTGQSRRDLYKLALEIGVRE